MKLVETAIRNAKLTISVLLFLMLAGALAYRSIPKEAEPDIQIPIIYVSMGYSGISPEDSERLLLRPMETALKSIQGIKQMTSNAYQGGGNVVIEFQAGADLDKALDDVRNKVDDARRDLPDGVDEPSVNEVNISEFPVLVVTLSGDVPERVLNRTARELRDRIEEIPGVLDAALQGVRDDLVEVIIDPAKLTSYGIRPDVLIGGFQANNQLIAAGSMEGAEGRYAIKVPSLIETVEDLANLPVISDGTAIVRARDLAEIRPTFKDPETITRLDGAPAVAIEVSKRTGANLIETVDKVKAITEEFRASMPEGVTVSFSQDKSKDIRQLLSDLQNSVLTAVILVFIVILYALSGRSSILIGLAIPASFLMGILGLNLAGLTVNIVVLFSLILAVGHAGRRRDHRDGIRRTPDERRHGQEAGLRRGQPPHGGAGHLVHRDAHCGVLAAAVLAGDRRRVHEIHADHPDRHAVGQPGLCADLRADAGRDHRQAVQGTALSTRTGPICGSWARRSGIR